jgi:hypothetical protein
MMATQRTGMMLTEASRGVVDGHVPIISTLGCSTGLITPDVDLRDLRETPNTLNTVGRKGGRPSGRCA